MRGLPPSRCVPYAVFVLLWPSIFLGAPKKAVLQSPWQVAEGARQHLLAIAPEKRTANEYRSTLDAYRAIYHADPADMHSPEAIFEVGLLLADEGVTLHQPKVLEASIGQLEFLRTQYPQSSFRVAALLEEAHVAANDLHDVKLARAKYAEFIEQYPRSTHIAEAQAALQQLRAGKLPSSPGPRTMPETNFARQSAAASSGVPGAAVPPEVHAEASLAASQGSAAQPVAVASPGAPRSAESSSSMNERGAAVQDASAQVPAHTSNGLATISGIRHWSTPTYTRVAIDLGDDVQYEAARVPNPDRIYFDLHGTRLPVELAGKAFNVTDDGYLKRIRAAQYSPDISRVVFDVSDVQDYSAFILPNPYRLIIDIHGSEPAAPVPSTAGTGTSNPPQTRRQQQTAADSGVVGIPDAVQQAPIVRMPPAPAPDTSAAPSTVATRAATGREVASLSTAPDTQRATPQPTSQPIAVIAPTKSMKRSAKNETAANITSGRPASPTADGQRTLQRALGLKIGRIVIDPGHGGHDSGTIGVDGIMEKDVVLDVALRLGTLLHDRLGAEIIYTRSDDTFIPLETRTAIANKAQADLFISVHANSSDDETARGVETYYLNFTTQPDALDVAARENAVSDQGVHQLADLVKKITLKDKIDESREFASNVEQSLFEGLHKGNEGLKNRGVKKAPFVVLIGANMPSILTEISFVTNGRDAAQLRTPEYRERVAESIYRGVAAYNGGLSGTRVATASAKATHAE